MISISRRITCCVARGGTAFTSRSPCDSSITMINSSTISTSMRSTIVMTGWLMKGAVLSISTTTTTAAAATTITATTTTASRSMLTTAAQSQQQSKRKIMIRSISRMKSSHHQINGKLTETSSSSVLSTTNNQTLLLGCIFDHAINLQNVRPGDKIDSPYELTISETLQDFWFAAFFDHSRIHTSRPFCRSIGLQDRSLPFPLALFLTSSMTHADAAKVQVGFGKVSYLWPLFAGDTIRKSFTVTQIRNTSDKNHSVIHFSCDLINQRDRLCMRADKRMLFQFAVPESQLSARTHEPESVDTHLFRDHILSKANTVFNKQPSHSLAKLEPGQLILHTMHRSLPFSVSQQLASLARLTHERHFDSRKYDVSSEILVPGGLVLGITMSASARDLHEILHEEIQSCAYINSLHPDMVVGAISYVSAVDDSLPGDLELVTVTTLGVKMNVKLLDGVPIPLELFQQGIFSKEVEKICKEMCPILSNKIVLQVHRKILRQSSRRDVFLL